MLFSPWMGLINFRSWGRAKRTLSLRKRMGIECRGSGQAPFDVLRLTGGENGYTHQAAHTQIVP